MQACRINKIYRKLCDEDVLEALADNAWQESPVVPVGGKHFRRHSFTLNAKNFAKLVVTAHFLLKYNKIS